VSQDNNFSQGPVPQSARKGVLALTFVMLGLTFFSASMWTGGTLGTGLSYHDFFLAVLIGNLLLGIYTSFLGYIGAKTGLTTHLLARFSFGVKGSWLPSLLLGGTQVGWFGVGVAMFAIPVGKATGLDINLLIAVSGVLMTVTVFFGISALTVLSVIAVPAIACLGGYSVWLAVNGMGGGIAY
jgi:cytosine permease